ncbi:MAG: cupredoxin domain-containing protein [Planctomycetota bacterium]|jgi:cytochrome c oxidase subunit 2
MNRKMILPGILLVVCTAGPIVGTLAYEAYRTRDLTAEIIARTPEKGNFSPGRVSVAAGEKVKLRVRNVDTVTHGFAIPALGVDAGEIKAGHTATVEFTPQVPGQYDYYCTVWCSEFHLQMRGILDVVTR